MLTAHLQRGEKADQFGLRPYAHVTAVMGVCPAHSLKAMPAETIFLHDALKNRHNRYPLHWAFYTFRDKNNDMLGGATVSVGSRSYQKFVPNKIYLKPALRGWASI